MVVSQADKILTTVNNYVLILFKDVLDGFEGLLSSSQD